MRKTLPAATRSTPRGRRNGVADQGLPWHYIVCQECGRRYKYLSNHLLKIHGTTGSEYKEAHGVRFVMCEEMRWRKITWPPERVIDELRTRWEKREPLASHKLYNMPGGEALFQVAVKRFGSWEAAIRAAGIAYESIRRTRKWTSEQVVEELRNRVRKGLPLTTKALSETDNPLLMAATKRFGSWEAAVRSVGVDYDQVKMLHSWSKGNVTRRIRERARRGLSLTPKVVRVEDNPLRIQARRKFGSYERALEAAGFKSESVYLNKRWTNEKVLDAIRLRHAKGKTMVYSRVREERGGLADQAKKRFNGWYRAMRLAGLRSIPVQSSRRDGD